MKSKPSATLGETDSSASENEHRFVSRFWGVRYQLREVNRAVAFQHTSELVNVLTYRPVLTQVADGRPIIAVDPDFICDSQNIPHFLRQEVNVAENVSGTSADLL